MVFSHLLTITNHTEHYAQLNRNGRWSSNADFCYWDTQLTELAGKTMGIIGLGNIGQRVAQIAQAFGMKVKAMTSKEAHELPQGIQKTDLNDLLATSDVLSLHCPLTESTRGLICRESICKIAAYCADVMAEEPPKADDPLLNHPNAYFTPHIAWATKEARIRLLQIAIGNVRSFIMGKPINTI